MARVYVGMSGGVDSSLAAALLVEQGHEVTGVYMKNWSQDLPGMKCPWAEDLADAKRVAVQLGIDFKVYDFEREYKQQVVDYMVDEYKAGRTPNPDIMCNQEVKFKLFLEAALKDGAEMIATGHYARVRGGLTAFYSPLASSPTAPSLLATSTASYSLPLPSSPILTESAHRSLDAGPASKSAPSFEKSEISSKAGAAPLTVTRLEESVELASSLLDSETSAQTRESDSTESRRVEDCLTEGSPADTLGELLRARDEGKDQTYFLYRVSGEALGRVLFPLGGYLKSEVRDMAKQRGLWTASKSESMGVCFVGNVGVREFLSQYVETVPGDIIDKSTGEKLGTHDGAIYWTLGQRHGLDIGGGLPYYVVGKDMERNEVYVTTDLNDGSLWLDTVKLASVHWINGQPSAGRYSARVRHRAKLVPAQLEFIQDEVIIKLDNPERAITPGQSVVLYSDETCLGGGIVV